MSICESGVDCKVQAKKILVDIPNNHPLIKLAQALPWRELINLIIPDIKITTPRGLWWRGRKLKVRIHLGVYLLQQMYNKTDRQTEYDLKDNAAFQIFCGKGIVKKWHAPDHTKIEKFRSRLSPDTQQKIANTLAAYAVKLGIADASRVDVDSTVQEANITYPTDAKMLRKLGSIAAKVCEGINHLIPDSMRPHVDLKEIASTTRDYFFRNKNTSSEEKYALLSNILDSVSEPVKQTIAACNEVSDDLKKKLPWNIKRAIKQIVDYGADYLQSVRVFIETGKAKVNKRLSFHANDVACFGRDKPHKKYEFGRFFQLGRLAGNILFITKSYSVKMHDKSSLKPTLEEHERLFGKNKIDSLATDKGYYSERNVKMALKKGISEIGIQVPCNTSLKETKLSDEAKERLRNRRAGIEPLIGHIKQKGQMGKSRMKNDQNVESSGYTAVLGFNLRQITKAITIRDQGEGMVF